jgi:predicted DNA binding CopG/RHH family protein
MSTKLTREEKELLDSYESDEWVSVQTDKSIEKYQAAARETFKKDKRVNIRISGKDLELLQERALIEGIPYQTLMSSVLHKFVYGNLIDKSHKKQSKTDA